MKVNEYLPNLGVEVPVWFDALERFYRPWEMAYFRPFSNVIKTSRAARKKYLQYGGDHRWRHVQVLYSDDYTQGPKSTAQCGVE
jgi:hypothetical protein